MKNRKRYMRILEFFVPAKMDIKERLVDEQEKVCRKSDFFVEPT